MKRRNFFALLFAPIAAKFWPKTELLPIGPSATINVITYFDNHGNIFQDYGDGPIQISNLYHHGQPPVMFLGPFTAYPWVKNKS